MKTFRIGGVHPAENKLSAAEPIKVAELPKVAVFPMGQHIGAPALPIVQKGDKVKVGTQIAKPMENALSTSIFSSVSGTVLKVDTVVEASGYKKPAVYIAVEGDEWEEAIDRSEKLVTLKDKPELTPESIIEKVKNAGIVGMGEKIVDALGHDYKYKLDSANSALTYTCQREGCNDSKTESVASKTVIGSTPATCSESATTIYKVVTSNGKTFDNVVIEISFCCHASCSYIVSCVIIA